MCIRVKTLVELLLISGLVFWGACSAGEGVETGSRADEPVEQAETGAPEVTFEQEESVLHIAIGGKPLADYIFEDPETSRPFFAHVQSPAGIQVTRNRPPVEGEDLMDHKALHPGIWMSFGDISGNDYWRLKAPVRHESFIKEPSGGAGRGTFTVRNLYLEASTGDPIAREDAEYTILVQPQGYLLIQKSSFALSGDRPQIVFGDQEEMAFSVRVQTPLAEERGGKIVDAKGRDSADQIWSQSADWIDYSGELEGRWVGVTIMPDPANFRESWYHVRDYGFVGANPFGREAMNKGAKSEVVVQQGEELTVGFGVLIHSSDSESDYDPAAAYRGYLEVTGAGREETARPSNQN